MNCKHPSEVGRYQIYALMKAGPDQTHIAGKLLVSHETLYRHVDADKTRGGKLLTTLRCQEQKRRRYSSGRGRQGKILHRSPLKDLPTYIEVRRQAGHWECDTIMGANQKGFTMTMVERNSGIGVIAKVAHKISEFVSKAFMSGRWPFEGQLKTLTYDNAKEFASYIKIDTALKSTGYFARAFASWERSSNDSLNSLLVNFCLKRDRRVRLMRGKLK